MGFMNLILTGGANIPGVAAGQGAGMPQMPGMAGGMPGMPGQPGAGGAGPGAPN